MVSPQPLDQGPNGRVLPPGNPVSGTFLPAALQASHLSPLNGSQACGVKSLSAQLDSRFPYAPSFSGHRGSILFPLQPLISPSPPNPEASVLFSQGDKEAELGLPFSPLCDRTSTLVAQSQIGESEGKRKGNIWACLQLPKLLFLLRQGLRTGWRTLRHRRRIFLGSPFQVVSNGKALPTSHFSKLCYLQLGLCSLSPLLSSPSEASLLIKHFLQVSLTSLWSQPSLC